MHHRHNVGGRRSVNRFFDFFPLALEQFDRALSTALIAAFFVMYSAIPNPP
jgi:hypothetical protein